jgi:zinc transporter, ZIP family
VTIVLGLPAGRLRRPAATLRAVLNAVAIGILLFLVWDVVTHAWEPIDSALGRVHDHAGGLAPVFGYGALFAAGIAAGLGSLVAYEMWMGRAGAAPAGRPGLGALSEAEAVSWRVSAWSPERRLALMIATGIGLHNFAEGLAIGVSAKAGEVSLATVLIIGFGLHNTTEGFGIVGPLGSVRPSWSWLGVAGFIGGAPTLLGTLVGYQVNSEPLQLLFYALAGGAVLYVIGEIWTGMRRYGHRTLGLYMIAAGFLTGVGTDLIVSYGGG